MTTTINILEKIPSFELLRKNGLFLGYDQYDEVYEYKRKKFIVLDGLDKKNKVVYNVSRWFGKKNQLVKGYSEYTGEPVV